MKGKGTNLSTMINVCKQIVYYEKFRILAPFEGVCFGRAHFIVWQYAISDEKIRLGSYPMNIKFAQSSIQAYITWPKI